MQRKQTKFERGEKVEMLMTEHLR